MADNPEPSVIFGKRDCASMIAKKKPTRCIVLHPASAILRIYLTNLCCDELAQGLRMAVTLISSLVDLVDDGQEAAGKTGVEIIVKHPNQVQRSGNISPPNAGQNCGYPVSPFAMDLRDVDPAKVRQSTRALLDMSQPVQKTVCVVTPTGHKVGHVNLTNWVATQRSNKDTLSPERWQRLDEIGFIWDAHIANWEDGFAALESFKEREGHCRVPDNKARVDGLNLGGWVSRQRENKGLSQ